VKVFLASYWEPENHGPGRKIGISPSKPKNLMDECGYDCELCFNALSPGDLFWDYHKDKKLADDDEELLKQASDKFLVGYKELLNKYKETLISEAKDSNYSIFDFIGLEEGDTLLSWEKEGHLTYRDITAEFLKDMGYEVETR
jgi:hypothetical protein